MDACRRFRWLAAVIFVYAATLHAQLITPFINPPNGNPPGLQGSDACSNPPFAGPVVTSGSASPAGSFCLFINGAFAVSSTFTVTWTNTVTNVSQVLSIFSLGSAQIQVVVPGSLYSAAVTAPQSVTIKVTQGSSAATATFTVEPPLGLPPSGHILPSGAVGVAYSQPMASGGSPPFGSEGGPYPPGLSPAAGTYVLTGTPVAPSGVTSFSIPIFDAWGNTITNSLSILIVDPQTITPPLIPASAPAGSPNFPLTVNGANYVPDQQTSDGIITGSTVYWSVNNVLTPLQTTFVNANQLTAIVPQSLLVTPRNVNILVAPAGGPPSNPVPFAVLAPVITSISPSTMTARSTPVPFTVNGANFISNGSQSPLASTILINGSPIPTGFSGTGPLLSLQTFATPGTYSVQVVNPGGTTSNTLTLTVLPTPTITSLSPSFAIAGGPGFNIAVNGTGFTNTMTVLFNGLSVAATFQSSTQLIAAVPAGLIQSVANVPVTVVTFDNVQSAPAIFAITTNLRIVTTSLPPATSGQFYDVFVNAAGGQPSYGWSATGLPFGLTIDAKSGEIRGTVNTSQSFTVIVTVTDAARQQASASFLVNVTVPPPPIRIDTTASLPSGTVGVPYTGFIGASGGSGNLTISATGLPAGLTMSATGFITGTPTTFGTFNVTVQAKDDSGNSATAGYQIVIKPAPLTVTGPATIDPIPPGTAISIQFGATGGIPPYSFNSTGRFPDGTGLNRNGSLTGTATTPGTYSFTIFAIDSAGTQASKGFTITIALPALSITATFLNGQVGVPYSAAIGATGGQPPYNFTVAGLPDGLSYSNGAVTGTPTAAGSFTATVNVTDAANGKASQTSTIVIAPAVLTVTTTSLANGTVGAAYSASVSAAGGVPPYAWTFSGLPAGITGSSSGALSGNPTTAGSSTVTATVTDAKGQTANKQFTITIAVPPLAINPTSLATAVVGTPVSTTFTATGGVPPYTWSAAGLPAGLTLSTAGVLSGSPTAPGTPSFTVAVKDSAGTTATLTVKLSVSLPATPPVNLTGLPATSSPATQSTLQVGLGSPYPVDVTVVLTLTFAADSGPDDPAVQFASGGRVATIVIPAGSTTPINVPLQTGTVAGIATITTTLSASSQDITPTPVPTRTVRIAPLAPTATSVTATATSGGFAVTVIGYSTTRSLTQAIFTVNFVSGNNPPSSTFTIPVDTLFSGWYNNPASAAFGSQFTYTQNFNVTGGLSTIANVSVVLVNNIGSSPAVTVTIK